MGLDHLETSLAQHRHHFGQGEKGGVEVDALAEHLGGVQGSGPAVHGEQKGPFGCENPVELTEDGANLGSGDMDQGVEADQSSQRTVEQAERGYVAPREHSSSVGACALERSWAVIDRGR